MERITHLAHSSTSFFYFHERPCGPCVSISALLVINPGITYNDNMNYVTPGLGGDYTTSKRRSIVWSGARRQIRSRGTKRRKRCWTNLVKFRADWCNFRATTELRRRAAPGPRDSLNSDRNGRQRLAGIRLGYLNYGTLRVFNDPRRWIRSRGCPDRGDVKFLVEGARIIRKIALNGKRYCDVLISRTIIACASEFRVCFVVLFGMEEDGMRSVNTSDEPASAIIVIETLFDFNLVVYYR